MPAALAESSTPSQNHKVVSPPKPSTTVQSLLYRLENQPKSDKVVITRATLAAIQQSLADSTRKEKETLMSNDMLSRALADFKTRYEEGVQSRLSEKTKLDQTIKDLKKSLVAAKKEISKHKLEELESVKAENRQLQLDLYKERLMSKQLLAQVEAEKDQKETLHHLLQSKAKTAERLERMISSLSFQE
jgi:hypothetical protein